MTKAPAKKAATKPAAEKKAAVEAQFAEADAKGAPSDDHLANVAARFGVTGL